MINCYRFMMFRTSCFLSPFPHKYTFQGTLFFTRLLVCCSLALSLSLAACGSGVQQDRTETMIGQQTVVGQQTERLGTELTLRAPLGDYSAQSVSGDYAGYVSMNQFIEEMVQKHGFERDYLRSLFSQARRKSWTLEYLAKSDQAMKKKPVAGGWTRYRSKFLDERHIAEGVDFSHNHRVALQRASQQYGVPEEYILGILAVETRFGGNVGNHRVLDALTTLSFDYARRGDYFRSELENFLLMTRSEGLDPAKPVGSFAGAMGLGQFMPSSFLQLAVDFNMDGRRDLWDPEDAIGSIANYLAHYGWKPGQPVVTPLKAQGAVALEPGININNQYTMAEIEQAGLYLDHPSNINGPFHLLLVRHIGYDQYLIGHPNFYTITRYNHSVYYAMAVHELAQAIKQRL
jgi:membrane-bound lytic murein transglycosylase B